MSPGAQDLDRELNLISTGPSCMCIFVLNYDLILLYRFQQKETQLSNSELI